jgi:hypothetical protein
MKVLASQTLVAPFAAFALLRTALGMFVTNNNSFSASQNASNRSVLQLFSEGAFKRTKSSQNSNNNNNNQHSPVRLTVLIILLSVLRAIFVFAGGRWFYKHIVRGIMSSSSSFIKAIKYLNLSIPLQNNNNNTSFFSLQNSSKIIGVTFVTLSGILLQLVISRARQELFNQIESGCKKMIATDLLLNKHKLANPYSSKAKNLSTHATATMLHDTISVFAKSCLLGIESASFFCGTMMASNAMTTSIFSSLIPSITDWSAISGFMSSHAADPKRAGFELVKLFGFVHFINVIPASLQHGLRPSKQNISVVSSSSSSGASSDRLNRWLPLMSETLRQSQILSSNICTSEKEREAFIQNVLRITRLSDSSSSSSSSNPLLKLEQQLADQEKRLTSSNAKKRAAASAAIDIIKDQIERQKVTTWDLFNPFSALSSLSSFIQNPVLFSILVANSLIGLDSGFNCNDSSLSMLKMINEGNNSQQHSTAILQWVSLVQSSMSIFACAAELGKSSSRLAPLLSSSSTSARSFLLSSETSSTSEAPTQVGYVSLHRQEAKLVGKVTVVESQLFTGNDAGAASSTNATPCSSLDNSLSGSAANKTINNNNNNLAFPSENESSSTSSPVPTLSNSCSLPFHLYPGAGLLVATETSKIGEMFISSAVASIQNAFSSSSAGASTTTTTTTTSTSANLVEIITSEPLIVPCLSLADQITFPRKAKEVENAGEWELFTILSAAGLGHLVEEDHAMLHQVPVCSASANEILKKGCEINLTPAQCQQLAVARVLFRKPRYVILWNCLFNDKNNNNTNSSSMQFKAVTDSLKKAGITVVSVFTCSQILDWSIRRVVMSCHFNGLFLRDDDIFSQKSKSTTMTTKNNNNNKNNNSGLVRSDSMDSSATSPLGFGGDYCSAAFGILQNPPPIHMLSFPNYGSIVALNDEDDFNMIDQDDDDGEFVEEEAAKGKNNNHHNQKEIPSFSPETFLSFSRVLSRSTVAVNMF